MTKINRSRSQNTLSFRTNEPWRKLLTTINIGRQKLCLECLETVMTKSSWGSSLLHVTNEIKSVARLFYIGAGTSGTIRCRLASECPPNLFWWWLTYKEVIDYCWWRFLPSENASRFRAEDDQQSTDNAQFKITIQINGRWSSRFGDSRIQDYSM